MVKLVLTGRGASMSLPGVVDRVTYLSGKQSPDVLYIGTPSFDDEEKYKIQTNGLRKVGCSFQKLDISERPSHRPPSTIANLSNSENNINDIAMNYPTKEEISELVDNADVILVSGGNTQYAIKRWIEFGVDEMLRQAARREGNPPVLCGGSAGAICWFSHGHSDSLNPATFLNPDPNLTEEEKNDWKHICVPGIQLIPALCVPHYDAMQHNGLLRSEDSDKMAKEDRFHNYPCIGIDEDAAFVMDGDRVNVISHTSRHRRNEDGSEMNGESEKEYEAKCYWKMFNSRTQEFDVKPLFESHGDYFTSDLGLC